MKRFGKSAGARVGTAAFLSALRVLVRKHPAVAMEMAGVGLKKAGATGIAEVKARLHPPGQAEAKR